MWARKGGEGNVFVGHTPPPGPALSPRGSAQARWFDKSGIPSHHALLTPVCQQLLSGIPLDIRWRSEHSSQA